MAHNKLEKKIEKKKEDLRITSKLSHKALAHLDTLRHYYKVNMAQRIVTIPMHFEKVEDILDVSLSTHKNPFINRDILSKISKLSHSIPGEFKIDLDLKIDDYQGYKHNDIASAILDAFEMFQYDVVKYRTGNALKVSCLIIIGVVVFAWLFYLCSKHWFGQSGDPVHDTIHELIYTIAGVVLWEALYIIFLPSISYDDISYMILIRINAVNLLDKNNKTLQIISGHSMHKYWKVDTKAERRSRFFLLVTGTALMCIAGCKLCDVVEIFIKYNSIGQAIALASVDIAIIIVTLLSGIGAISYFRDKGPFKKLILPFGIVTIIGCLFEIIFVAILFNNMAWAIAVKSLTLGSIILALSICYIVCIAILRKKQPIKPKVKLGLSK